MLWYSSVIDLQHMANRRAIAVSKTICTALRYLSSCMYVLAVYIAKACDAVNVALNLSCLYCNVTHMQMKLMDSVGSQYTRTTRQGSASSASTSAATT
jgi:hypothetical protein